MKIAIINLEDGVVQATYSDDAPSQHKFGGPWGWANMSVHVEIPEELAEELMSEGLLNVEPNLIKGVQDEDGNWSVVENS